MVTETEQQFAYVLTDIVTKEQTKHYFLPFNGTDSQACGYLSISPEASLTLIGHMLRDSDTGDDPEKELSLLEETILMDIVTAIIDSFTDAVKEECSTALRRTSKFVKGNWPLHTENLDDMCSISMTVSHPDGSLELTFVMLSNILEAVVGGKPINTLKPSPQKISNMLMQTMHEAPVRVAAQLCSASISLNDIMNLQKDDILLLGKTIDDPIDVLLNEHLSFKGHQAKSHGKYAVVITKQEEE
jgi:flagellar motor switch protein FliM